MNFGSAAPSGNDSRPCAFGGQLWRECRQRLEFLRHLRASGIGRDERVRFDRYLAARRYFDDDAAGTKILLRHLLHRGRADFGIPSKILDQVARIAREGVVKIQLIGPAAEAAHWFQRANRAGFKRIDRPLHFGGRGRLRLDAGDLLGDCRLNFGDRVAGPDRCDDAKVARQFLAVLIGLHVLGDLFFSHQRRCSREVLPPPSTWPSSSKAASSAVKCGGVGQA